MTEPYLPPILLPWQERAVAAFWAKPQAATVYLPLIVTFDFNVDPWPPVCIVQEWKPEATEQQKQNVQTYIDSYDWSEEAQMARDETSLMGILNALADTIRGKTFAAMTNADFRIVIARLCAEVEKITRRNWIGGTNAQDAFFNPPSTLD